MRMTFNRSSQLVLVSAASLLAAGLLTACGTLTTDFVYVTSAKAAGPYNYGEVDVFEINADSGRMRKIPASPFPSGGRNPVAAVPSPDDTTLYVVNRDDNTIVQFTIGSDGKLYPQNTVNTPGIFPIAVTEAGKLLVVANTYQPLPTCSPAAPCSGSIAVLPIGAGNVLGSAVVNSSISTQYWPLTLPSSPDHVIMPSAIASAASGAFVYVAAYDTSVSPTVGYVFGFAVNSDGSLNALNGGIPFSAGKQPSGIASSPDGGTIYVSDRSGNSLLAYSASNGLLTPIAGSPFAAGNSPSAVVADATGSFVYVANAVDSTLIGYTTSGGSITPIGSYTTGSQPVAVGIDPSLNQYLFTANFLGDTVSGFQINATSGTLLNSQFSPYPSNANPTAVAAIPHKTS